jgi:hypothetical protein
MAQSTRRRRCSGGAAQRAIARSAEGRQSREYLLPEEVDAMMKAIKKHGGRHAHRDATLVLLLYRHRLRCCAYTRFQRKCRFVYWCITCESKLKL